MKIREAMTITDFRGVEGLFRASRGVPCLIDRVAEASLLLALADKSKEFDADMVAQAVQEVEP